MAAEPTLWDYLAEVEELEPAEAPPPPPVLLPPIEEELPEEPLDAIEAAAEDLGLVPGQATLFGADDEFTIAGQEWHDMPEYVQEDQEPWKSLPVHFESREALDAFAELVGQNIGPKARSIWYPAADIGHFADKRYHGES